MLNPFTIHQGHVLDVLKSMTSESVHCVVTSPPYLGLRAYQTEPQVWGGDPNCEHDWIDTSYQAMKNDNKGNRGDEKQRTNIGTMGRDSIRTCGTCGTCGAWRGELGLEPTPDLFIEHLVSIFREVKRVMRDDALLWVNIGDSYSGSWGNYSGQNRGNGSQRGIEKGSKAHQKAYDGLESWRPPQACKIEGMKPGDLLGIPWALATALRVDGWYLRRDIIWCLSGGAWLYARTQKGDMPIMVRDLARLRPSTVKLWNGTKWTQLLGMSKSKRRGDELEIVLRSGERISCTPTHQWPTNRGIVAASELSVGDILETCQLPQPDFPRDCVIDEDAAWFAGLYLAEGSRTCHGLQISGHVKRKTSMA